MTSVPEAVRFLGAVAVMLAFGMLAGGRVRPFLYAGQCAAVGLTALLQAAAGADLPLAAVAAVLAVQGAWLLPALRRAPPPGAVPFALLGVGLLLVAAATVAAPAPMAAALGLVLVGLLGAAAGAGPYGVLCLLNGADLALAGAPGLPLQPVLAAGLAALGVLVADARRSPGLRR